MPFPGSLQNSQFAWTAVRRTGRKPSARETTVDIKLDVHEGSRTHGRDDTSGHLRRRISVSCGPWGGSVRPLLMEERTSRCSARYCQRGDRVGEVSHPGPVSRFHGVSTLVTSVRDVVDLPTQPVSGTLPTWVDSPVTGECASQERASAVEIAVGAINHR